MFNRCSGMFAVVKAHIDWENMCMTQVATVPTIIVNYYYSAFTIEVLLLCIFRYRIKDKL